MRAILATCGIMILIAALAACGNQGPPEPQETRPPETTSPSGAAQPAAEPETTGSTPGGPGTRAETVPPEETGPPDGKAPPEETSPPGETAEPTAEDPPSGDQTASPEPETASGKDTGGTEGPPDLETAAPIGCGDFLTFEEVDEFFRENGGPDQDPYHLDTDQDGIPCNAASDQGSDTQLFTAPPPGAESERCRMLTEATPPNIGQAGPEEERSLMQETLDCMTDRELVENAAATRLESSIPLTEEQADCMTALGAGEQARRIAQRGIDAHPEEDWEIRTIMDYLIGMTAASCLSQAEWDERDLGETERARMLCTAGSPEEIREVMDLMLDEATPEAADQTQERMADCAQAHPADPLPECGPLLTDGTRHCPER